MNIEHDGKLFTLANDAPDFDTFMLAVHGKPKYYAGNDWDAVDAEMRKIYDIAHTDVIDLFKMKGLNHREAADLTGITNRAIIGWASKKVSHRNCVVGVRYLIACRLGLI